MRYHGYLFVHPMLWNVRHLEVTGCHFEDIELANGDWRILDQQIQQNDELQAHLRQLEDSTSPIRKADALSRIICYKDSPIVKRT